jgi:hypothetical protein
LRGCRTVTYRWDFAIGKRREDAIELELVVDILLLQLLVDWDVDSFARHDDGCDGVLIKANNGYLNGVSK